MMIALAAKLLEKNLLVVDDLQLKVSSSSIPSSYGSITLSLPYWHRVQAIKTKELYNLLKLHQLHEKHCLFVDCKRSY